MRCAMVWKIQLLHSWTNIPQQRDANCINFTCLIKGPYSAIIFCLAGQVSRPYHQQITQHPHKHATQNSHQHPKAHHITQSNHHKQQAYPYYNGITNKQEGLKQLTYITQPDIITIQAQQTQQTHHHIQDTQNNKLHFHMHRQSSGVRRRTTHIHQTQHNIHVDIPRNINTHNTELQMVRIHTNRDKHFTIAKLYIPPRDTA